ncbi:MAG TPA: hypothetical protein VKV74_01495 [Bryobacteraceae bacterium]|nr:hypothetical protein [Bryobacteraceae bacterium]
MLHPRSAAFAAALASGWWIPAFGQSVISTHSGVVYFFEGSVFLGDQPLQQKFGKFPDIGEGGQLRTEHGRAEVLLTPGVMLRVAENSSIRMISTSLSDTRVELIGGSAIIESNEPQSGNSVTLIHKNWSARIPHEGVFRVDSDPPLVTVYKGEVNVSAGDDAEVAVKQGQNLPLANVLVPEQAELAVTDPFKAWAMSRSQAVSSDNATAAGILDDPTQSGNADFSSYAGPPFGGGFSYFPPSIVPGLSSPYGVSFWSPFQSSLSSMYFPAYLYGLYGYGSLYPAWPGAIRLPIIVAPSRISIPALAPSRTGFTSPGSVLTPRPPFGVSAPRTITPHPVAPHLGGRR